MASIFPFPPDWQNGVREVLGYKTEIITSRGQEEQRIALRQRHRRSIEFEMKLSRGDLQYWTGWAARNHQGEFWFTDRTRWSELAGAHVTGATELTFAELPRWATPNGSVFLWSGSEYTRYGISSTSGNKIVLDVPLTEDWPDGTRAHAGVLVRLDQSVKTRLLTNSAGAARVRLDEVPGTEKPRIGDPEKAFNYHELVLLKPNWRDPIEANLTGNLEVVDYDRGVTGYHSYTTLNFREEKLAFLGRTPEEADSFVQFFERCRGRQRPFFMPTWEDDLAGATGSGTLLTVPTGRFEQLYNGSDIYRAILVVYSDGTMFPVLIQSVTQNGSSDTEVTLVGALPQPVGPGTVTMVCLLPLWRFAADSITLEHRTNTVSQWTAAVTTLPNATGWPGGFHVPENLPGGQNLWLRNEFFSDAQIDLSALGLDPAATELTLGGSFLGATTTPDGVTANGIARLSFEFRDAADALVGSATQQVDTDAGPARAIIPPVDIPTTTSYVTVIDEAVPDNGGNVGVEMETRIQLGERI